ncbi:transcriptional regulatory protein [Deinococcus piscis]|uniref:Transcriptional regulatory protein n=1 Tax=Deinococcus piscis TaxID=394230 RepID=A0ABQ3K721_9DEIO|nr:response regulator [Deinococcus piscis]GHG02785.1 transcriptional regulatory protein [Deinococcus piscis]
MKGRWSEGPLEFWATTRTEPGSTDNAAMSACYTAVMIEDDPLVAQVNQGYLDGRPEYQVLGTAQTLAEGRPLLRQHRPDLLLLDVYLPDGSGLDLLAEARAEGWIQDVILLTAARDAASVQAALSGGAADFLIKPFTRSRLYAALDTIQQRHEAMRGGEREFTQGALDRLLGHAKPQHLPKRVEAHTLEKVGEVLRASSAPMSAEEVGRELGINRATAWRYLEQLTGLGQAELDMEYGGLGRPTKRYRWCVAPRS